MYPKVQLNMRFCIVVADTAIIYAKRSDAKTLSFYTLTRIPKHAKDSYHRRYGHI